MQRTLVALLFVTAARFAIAGTIENAACDQTGPLSYRISFTASPEAGPVAIYASGRADGIDSAGPVVVAAKSPADVTLSGATGRVYFHLKPKSGPARVVSIRRLPLAGAPNFRDLGGYRTRDGHYLRWGVVYRSGQLSGLTSGDYDYLAGIGLRLICDFRIDDERRRSPTNWQGSTAPEILPISVDTLTYVPAGATTRERMHLVYSRLPFDAIPQFGEVLRRIGKGELPAMVHCSGGKDRAGVFSALLLSTLGVPYETVKEDFLLTNRYVVPDERVQQMAADYQKRMKLDRPPDADTLRRAMGVDSEWLDIAYQAISQKYGSFDSYVRDGLKLSDADLTAIRRLLEDQ